MWDKHRQELEPWTGSLALVLVVVGIAFALGALVNLWIGVVAAVVIAVVAFFVYAYLEL